MAGPMTARSAHYAALMKIVDHGGATTLAASGRAKVLGAADALLFDEPQSERLVRGAEAVIESLELDDRWSAESCDQLREHLYGCGSPDHESSRRS